MNMNALNGHTSGNLRELYDRLNPRLSDTNIPWGVRTYVLDDGRMRLADPTVEIDPMERWVKESDALDRVVMEIEKHRPKSMGPLHEQKDRFIADIQKDLDALSNKIRGVMAKWNITDKA